MEYKEIILSKARWIITKADITSFLKLNASEIFRSFSEWRTNREIPRFVNWINFDNTLLLDFQTEIGIQLFLKSTQNKDTIILEEFLFTEEGSIVKNSKEEGFSNQFILSFYKAQS